MINDQFVLLQTLNEKVRQFQEDLSEETLREICNIYIELDASPATLEQLRKVLQVI